MARERARGRIPTDPSPVTSYQKEIARLPTGHQVLSPAGVGEEHLAGQADGLKRRLDSPLVLLFLHPPGVLGDDRVVQVEAGL
jgi:hypothetical protein